MEKTEKQKSARRFMAMGAIIIAITLLIYAGVNITGSFLTGSAVITGAPSSGISMQNSLYGGMPKQSADMAYRNSEAMPYPAGTQGNVAERAKPRVMRNASLTLFVKDVRESISGIEALAARAGGFVQASQIWEVRDGVRNGSATFRMPEQAFTAALDDVRKVALQVESEQITSQDVTAEYVDLRARLGAAEAEEMQYLQILQRAYQISDVLQVTQQLGNVRSRIESLKGQLQLMENQTDYSTITVTLKEEVPLSPLVQKWRPLQHVVDAWRALVSTLKWLVNVVIWLVIYILPLALIAYGIWKAVKGIKNRKGNTGIPLPPVGA